MAARLVLKNLPDQKRRNILNEKLFGSSSLSFSTNHSAFFFHLLCYRDCTIIIRRGAEKWTLHLYRVLFGIDPTANEGKLALLSLLITVQLWPTPSQLTLTWNNSSVFYCNRRQRLFFTCAEVRLCGDLHNAPAFWAYNSLHLVAIEGTLPPLDTFVL